MLTRSNSEINWTRFYMTRLTDLVSYCTRKIKVNVHL